MTSWLGREDPTWHRRMTGARPGSARHMGARLGHFLRRLAEKGDPAWPARPTLVRRVRPEGRGGQVLLLWTLTGGGREEGGQGPDPHHVILAHGEQQLSAGVIVHVVHNVPAQR